MDTVDYGEEGEMTIAGKAEPEADLNVYIDEEHVGTVESDDTGDWEVTPEEEVEPGSYTLRIDQVDPAGVVLARIETPAGSRPGPSCSCWAMPSWWCSRATASGASPGAPWAAAIHFTEIYEANRSQIKDPALIYPGQIFTVPGLESERAQASPSPAE